VDVGSACDACVEGMIAGTLDDGIGPGPDYLVRGRYFGTIYGFGSYRVDVFRPRGTVPIGSIRGRWVDEVDESGPGEFGGRFRICR
jgi:hypothetical protein